MKVAWSILRSLQRVDPPRPEGVGSVDHSGLAPVLTALAVGQTSALPETESTLDVYLDQVASIDPDSLRRDEALAFWINVYNGGALRLAARAMAGGHDSVLRVPGGFQEPFVMIAGRSLSLDDIEHAKIRRFRDPRVHSALVCGSVSCPTLRGEPYLGDGLDRQLDDQMRSFLANGGAVVDPSGQMVHLSRVFNWFGSDFVRPARMPTFLPSRSSRVLGALRPWLQDEAAEVADRGGGVEYQAYDWGLRCSVA